MATKHCFTPVTITPPAAGAPNGAAGGAADPYIITYVPDANDPTVVEPIIDAGENAPAAVIGKTFVEYDPTTGAATPIQFFKFSVNNTNPKYITKHDDHYNAANVAVNIDATKPYLIMRQGNDGMRGGSKSARKGRKSARKGRKSARKSRRARGSRSKK